jgi:uncharacterized RDD family membrane protein YckC
MPTTDQFWSVAAQVVSERGGLVVGFREDAMQPKLGSKLDNVLGFTPLTSATVVGVSNWMDWNEQSETFYRLRPAWGRGKAADPNAKYYRVMFQPDGLLSIPAPDPAAESFFPTGFSTGGAALSFAGYADATTTLEGATFWPRFAARLIDFVLHYFVGFIGGLLFIVLLSLASGGHPPLWALVRLSRIHIPTFIAALLGFVAYQVICTSVYGSSLGKLILSLQVLQDDGTPCRPKSAVIRELGYFVDALFFGLIAYYSMQEDPQQKRLGDDWAHTVVCKRANVPAESRQVATRFILGLTLGICADIALAMIGMLVQMSF